MVLKVGKVLLISCREQTVVPSIIAYQIEKKTPKASTSCMFPLSVFLINKFQFLKYFSIIEQNIREIISIGSINRNPMRMNKLNICKLISYYE